MDISSLENDGIYIHRDEDSHATRTTLIVGVPRSGTSMPASALYHLGVFMGDGIDQAVFEDTRLAGALEEKKEDVSTVIQDYNQRFAVWAFKRPFAWGDIEKNIKKFRNPRFVVMFRDPLAIAKRNNASMDFPVPGQLLDATKKLNDLVNFSLRVDAPMMMVSYEKAVSMPDRFVKSLAQFSGASATEAEIENAISKVQNGPENYLISSQVRFPRSQ